jgi:hypothetical protein
MKIRKKEINNEIITEGFIKLYPMPVGTLSMELPNITESRIELTV